MSITQAIYNRLINDATLKSNLAQFNGIPAVFTTMPIPDSATLPYIVSEGQVVDSTDTPTDAKNRVATTFMRDIRIYTTQTGSSTLIETLGEAVWNLFHRQPLTIDGWTVLEVRANRPILYPQDDVYGVVVTLTVTMQQNV